MQVLSTVPVMFGYWAKPDHGYEVARFLNDDITETVRRYPKRFVGLGTLPLQDPDRAVREQTTLARTGRGQGQKLRTPICSARR